MAIEIGKVSKIENDKMEVKIPAGVGCHLCPAKSACSFQGPNNAYRFLEMNYQPGIDVNDQLILRVSETPQNLSALIIFVSPVLIIFTAIFLSVRYLGIPYAEIIGLSAGILIYGMVLYISNRFLSHLAMFQPEILKIQKSEKFKKEGIYQ